MAPVPIDYTCKRHLGEDLGCGAAREADATGDGAAVGGSTPCRRICAQCADRRVLVEAVLLDAPVELGASEPEQARRLGLVALRLAERLDDEAALHGIEIHALGRQRCAVHLD